MHRPSVLYPMLTRHECLVARVGERLYRVAGTRAALDAGCAGASNDFVHPVSFGSRAGLKMQIELDIVGAAAE